MIKINEAGYIFLKQKKLTASEIKVVEKFLVHAIEKKVAASLFNSIKTVRFHKFNLFKKLQIERGVQLFILLFKYLYWQESEPKDALPVGTSIIKET